MNRSLQLTHRPRRRRRTPEIRELLQETHLSPADLIAPLFVQDDGPDEPVESMPGVQRLCIESLVRECHELRRLGIRAVALFPRIAATLKDDSGTEAVNPEGLIPRTVRILKQEVPSIQVITDIALDPYTTHGHDGLLTPDGSDVDNDPTVQRLVEMARINAEAGVDWVAPSDMMDGRVGAIRAALDAHGFTQTGILAYSVKFASAFYGPFRDAVGSRRPAGTAYLDKRTYQLNPANPRESMIEAALDEEEGADILMVKPAGPYLDIIRTLREQTALPVAAYQVSGEFAQIHAAARLGWLELAAARDESLLAIKRAGADLILTYFARDAATDWTR